MREEDIKTLGALTSGLALIVGFALHCAERPARSKEIEAFVAAARVGAERAAARSPCPAAEVVANAANDLAGVPVLRVVGPKAGDRREPVKPISSNAEAATRDCGPKLLDAIACMSPRLHNTRRARPERPVCSCESTSDVAPPILRWNELCREESELAANGLLDKRATGEDPVVRIYAAAIAPVLDQNVTERSALVLRAYQGKHFSGELELKLKKAFEISPLDFVPVAKQVSSFEKGSSLGGLVELGAARDIVHKENRRSFDEQMRSLAEAGCARTRVWAGLSKNHHTQLDPVAVGLDQSPTDLALTSPTARFLSQAQAWRDREMAFCECAFPNGGGSPSGSLEFCRRIHWPPYALKLFGQGSTVRSAAIDAPSRLQFGMARRASN